MTAREPYHGGVKSTDLTTLTPFQEVLEQGGITRETANTWQKVARVPEDKFEVYFTEAERKMGGMLKQTERANVARDKKKAELSDVTPPPLFPILA